MSHDDFVSERVCDISHRQQVTPPEMNELVEELLRTAEEGIIYRSRLFSDYLNPLKKSLEKYSGCVLIENERVTRIVSRAGFMIMFVANPSEELKKLAVMCGWSNIKYIKNPSEGVQKIAVQQEVSALRYIENPSERIQKLAVQHNGHALMYINNPSKEVQILAIMQSPSAIGHVENPSEGLQILAVERNGDAIIFIQNPSEKVQIAALRNNPETIKHIKNKDHIIEKLLEKLVPSGDDGSDDLCAICLAALNDDTHETLCCHCFHSNCLKQQIKNHVFECQICKKSLINLLWT